MIEFNKNNIVYCIENTTNGKIYTGSTSRGGKRKTHDNKIFKYKYNQSK